MKVHQLRPSASCNGSTCLTSLPSALREAMPVSRSAALLNTAIRAAWAATTTPSGSSSAQTRPPEAEALSKTYLPALASVHSGPTLVLDAQLAPHLPLVTGVSAGRYVLL